MRTARFVHSSYVKISRWSSFQTSTGQFARQRQNVALGRKELSTTLNYSGDFSGFFPWRTKSIPQEIFRENCPVRPVLFSASSDPALARISEAASVDELFEIVRGQDLTVDVAAQGLATLSHLNAHHPGFLEGHVDEYDVLKDKLSGHVDAMPLHVRARVLRALRRLNEPMSTELSRQLLISLGRSAGAMSLSTIVDFVAAVCNIQPYPPKSYMPAVPEKITMTFLTIGPILPRLSELIDGAETSEDVGSILFACFAVPYLISEDMTDKLIDKVSDLIDKGTLDPDKCAGPAEKEAALRTLVQVVAYRMLMDGQFSHKEQVLLRVGLLLDGHVGELDVLQLIVLGTAVSVVMWPASLIRRITDRVVAIVDGREGRPPESLDRFLVNMVGMSTIKHLADIDESVVRDIVRRAIEGPNFDADAVQLFDILERRLLGDLSDLLALYLDRLSKSRDAELMWMLFFRGAVIEHMPILSHADSVNSVDRLVEQANDGLARSRITRVFAELLATTIRNNLPIADAAVARFRAMLPQFRSHNLTKTGKAVWFRQRWSRAGADAPHNWHSIALGTAGRAAEELRTETNPFRITGLIMTLLRCANYIDEAEISETLKYGWDRYLEHNGGTITVNTVRNLSVILSGKRPTLELPFIMESFLDVVPEDTNDVHFLGYDAFHHWFGQTSRDNMDKARVDNYLDYLTRSIMCDMDTVPCYKITKAARTLAMHGKLTPELAVRLFDSKFMDRALAERNGYESKEFINRFLVADLNRAVCLFHPEFNVPWFNENYCEVQSRTLSNVLDKKRALTEEVFDALMALCNFDVRLVEERFFAKYWVYADFAVAVDADGNFVDVAKSDGGGEDVDRFAILVNSASDYTYDTRVPTLRAARQAQFLARLGYRVVDISPFDWSKMSMNSAAARQDYLAGRLGLRTHRQHPS